MVQTSAPRGSRVNWRSVATQPPETMLPDIRVRIRDELHERGLSATTQALNALVEAVTGSSADIVGDSDSLLLGLLRCGSYTVDLLRDSGANIDQLRGEAAYSAAYTTMNAASMEDPVRSLFSEAGSFGCLISRPELKRRPIEASDLLQEAVTPLAGRAREASAVAGHLRVDQDLALVAGEALLEFSHYIWERPSAVLRERREALSKSEHDRLVRVCGRSNADIIVRTLNRFILLNKPPESDEAFMALAMEKLSEASFGAGHFVSGGGRYQDLALSLRVAQRLAPERDQPAMVLLEEDGRIVVDHFSYRGNGMVQSTTSQTELLSVSSRLVLPLIAADTLRAFEALLNTAGTTEAHIQKFLERYPEILNSLGYTDCRPQVVLKEPGKGDLKPDFLLLKPGNSGFDILDLKLPSASILSMRPYPRASHEIAKAVAQLRAYRNHFQSPLNRDRFVKQHRIDYFEPSLIVTLGRQHQYPSAAVRNEIQQQSSGVRLMTYDELIAFASERTVSLSRDA